MQFIKDVHGSKEAAAPLIFGSNTNTVYVHDNIREIEVTDHITGETRTEYVYDEWQYSFPEWQILQNDEIRGNQLLIMEALLELSKGAL